MLDMLGADKKAHNVSALVAQITRDLDSSHDGKVSKDEFVKGLMANPALRAFFFRSWKFFCFSFNSCK